MRRGEVHNQVPLLTLNVPMSPDDGRRVAGYSRGDPLHGGCVQ